MKKTRPIVILLLLLLLLLLLALTGCTIEPEWEKLPEIKVEPTQAPPTPVPTPAFDMMEHLDGLLGGGHSIEGGTLRLQRDIVLTAALYLADCENISIDLNGHSIWYDAKDPGVLNPQSEWLLLFDGGRVHLYSSVEGAAIYCSAPGRIAAVTAMGHTALILDNISIEVRSEAEKMQSACCLYVTDGAYAEINGGVFKGGCGIFVEDRAQTGTTVIINGGTFGAEGTQYGACFKDTATIILNKGVFEGALFDVYAQGRPLVTVYDASFDSFGNSEQSGWTPLYPALATQEENASEGAQEENEVTQR